MLLSIIIPTKNEEKYLPILVESIKKQTFRDCEIIVADNDSADSTRLVAERFGCRVTGGGLPGAGRNKGAKIAKGEIFLFLDADVILPREDFLERALEEIKNKNLCVAVPISEFISNRLADKALSKLWKIWVISASKFSPSAGAACIFVFRAAHGKIQGFDEKIALGEDTDYIYRLSKICKFGILKSIIIKVSPRRLRKVGYLKVFFQIIVAGFYWFILNKKYLNNKIDYEFDIYGNKKLKDQNGK